MEFEIVVVTAPVPNIPFPRAFVVDGKAVVAANVYFAFEYDGVAGVGMDVEGLVAVVVVVVGATQILDGIAFVDIEGARVLLIVGHNDDGGVAGSEEALFNRGFAVGKGFVAPKIADVLAVGNEVVEVIAARGCSDGVEIVLVFTIGYPPLGGS